MDSPDALTQIAANAFQAIYGQPPPAVTPAPAATTRPAPTGKPQSGVLTDEQARALHLMWLVTGQDGSTAGTGRARPLPEHNIEGE